MVSAPFTDYESPMCISAWGSCFACYDLIVKKSAPKPMQTLQEASDYASSLRHKLFLAGWQLDFARYEGESNVAAECTPEEQYRRATLRFYPPFFKETLDGQKDIILHEMCHIITAVQNNLLCRAHDGSAVTPNERREAFERETSWIAGIISALL